MDNQYRSNGFLPGILLGVVVILFSLLFLSSDFRLMVADALAPTTTTTTVPAVGAEITRIQDTPKVVEEPVATPDVSETEQIESSENADSAVMQETVETDEEASEAPPYVVGPENLDDLESVIEATGLRPIMQSLNLPRDAKTDDVARELVRLGIVPVLKYEVEDGIIVEIGVHFGGTSAIHGPVSIGPNNKEAKEFIMLPHPQLMSYTDSIGLDEETAKTISCGDPRVYRLAMAMVAYVIDETWGHDTRFYALDDPSNARRSMGWTDSMVIENACAPSVSDIEDGGA